MAIARFFIPLPLGPGMRFSLPPGPARHGAKALRLKAGDGITLFNGEGGECLARIERIVEDELFVSVIGCGGMERESNLDIRLAQGISSGERMDYTLQKSVELGVAAIQPLALRRSVVKLSTERAERRVNHWQGVVIAACEQSGRNRVPEVAKPLDLPHWLAARPEGVRLLLSPESEQTLKHLAVPQGPVWLMAGPEGGFEPDEAKLAVQNGFVPVRLGPRILRTETAALAAISAMQMLWGDFGKGIAD
ncbi:MAG: 16S rRNA (uracil(1498)-N(3))-methyltransferase [Thiobacillaceae bacterium]